MGAYVSCRGYVGILLSARRRCRESKVAPRVVILFALEKPFWFPKGVLFSNINRLGGLCYDKYGRKVWHPRRAVYPGNPDECCDRIGAGL